MFHKHCLCEGTQAKYESLHWFAVTMKFLNLDLKSVPLNRDTLFIPFTAYNPGMCVNASVCIIIFMQKRDMCNKFTIKNVKSTE